MTHHHQVRSRRRFIPAQVVLSDSSNRRRKCWISELTTDGALLQLSAPRKTLPTTFDLYALDHQFRVELVDTISRSVRIKFLPRRNKTPAVQVPVS